MLALLFPLVGLATAAQHEIGVAAGGHGSLGLKTKILVLGAEGGLVYRLGGAGASALQLEVHDLWGNSDSGSVHLLGLRAGWSRRWGAGDSTLRPYSVVGLGGYQNEILPVLPVLWFEGGVEFVEGRLRWRIGPEIYALPPFFAGGGLRVTVTAPLGDSR